MLIKNDFEVAQPVDKVWDFFGNIPQVATCLPGAELTEDLGGEKYKGQVAVRMGPVRMLFAGTAEIAERDEAAKRGAAVLGYLADRGVPQDQLDRVRVPAGLDLGRTSHREIAVAILAELVRSEERRVGKEC